MRLATFNLLHGRSLTDGLVDPHRLAAAVTALDDDGHGEPCYGVGLISRHPVTTWQVTRLKPAPVRSPVYAPGAGGGGLILLRDEPRVVLAAVLDTPHGHLTVAATHLSFVPGWNVLQLRQVIRALRTLPAPRILLGDLNLPAWATRLTTGWHLLGRRPTYPAAAPRVQLDHALADRRGFTRLPPVTAVHTPLSTISDHRPLLVDLGPHRS